MAYTRGGGYVFLTCSGERELLQIPDDINKSYKQNITTTTRIKGKKKG